MKIPEQFDIVIKKLYPEIKEIKILKFHNFMSPISHIEYGVASDRYVVEVEIEINSGFDIVPSIEKYTEHLNTSFSYTYPDMGFVNFSVVRFIFPPKISNKEKFYQLFDIKV